jgi:translation elongation factor EF-1beta
LKETVDKQKKTKKPAPVAKSLVVLEVKPWGPDVDLDTLGKRIYTEIKQDGLFWKTEFKKEPVAFGVFKIVIGMTIEDDKVSVDDLIEKITEQFEEEV